MENYVVIDLGSNSVRLRITNIADDGTLTVTHQLKEYVRLSENMGQEKTLKQEPIKRTLQALKSFKDIYSKLENPNVNAIATAAVRQAANQKDFLDLVKKKLDLEFNVITGEREAYLDFLGDGTGSLSIFFCILGLCKRDKNFAAVSQNNKISHKELRLLLHCVTISREGE